MLNSWRWTNLWNIFGNWLSVTGMIQLRYPHYAPGCRENIDGNEMINVALNDYRSVCWSCTLYIVFFGHIFNNKHKI